MEAVWGSTHRCWNRERAWDLLMTFPQSDRERKGTPKWPQVLTIPSQKKPSLSRRGLPDRRCLNLTDWWCFTNVLSWAEQERLTFLINSLGFSSTEQAWRTWPVEQEGLRVDKHSRLWQHPFSEGRISWEIFDDSHGQKSYLGVFRINTSPSDPQPHIFLFRGAWGKAVFNFIRECSHLGKERSTQHRLPYMTL